MTPKISVILLTYNSSDTLREALDSVLRQKCGYDFEIVAGDDGSTDGTQSILQEYAARHRSTYACYCLNTTAACKPTISIVWKHVVASL